MVDVAGAIVAIYAMLAGCAWCQMVHVDCELRLKCLCAVPALQVALLRVWYSWWGLLYT